MSRSQRTKGAAYEREVANAFSDALGDTITRRLGQARDGGHDLSVGPLIVECKRRHALAVVPWLEQAADACVGEHAGKYPVVVTRADHSASVVVLRLDHFLALVGPQLTGCQPSNGVDHARSSVASSCIQPA